MDPWLPVARFAKPAAQTPFTINVWDPAGFPHHLDVKRNFHRCKCKSHFRETLGDIFKIVYEVCI